MKKFISVLLAVCTVALAAGLAACKREPAAEISRYEIFAIYD